MHSKMTGYLITLIVGLAIGAGSVVVIQLPYTTIGNSSLQDSALSPKGPFNSAASITVPDTTLEGTVEENNNGILTVGITAKDGNEFKDTGAIVKMQIFSDTEILENNVDNPSLSSVVVGQHVTASGMYDDSDILLVKYLAISSIK